MTPEWLATLERRAWEVAARRLPADLVATRALVAAVRRLSDRYVHDRGDTPPGALLAARLLLFTVADAPKLGPPLAELSAAGLLPPRPRVLDAGAGCGALSAAAAALCPGARVEAWDRDAEALALAADLSGAETLRVDLCGALPRNGRYHLVLLGNALAEIPAARRPGLVAALMDRTAPSGSLLIIEPALRETSRALERLRDELLAAGVAGVFAPCTHAGPCPMLARERDWCHESRAIELPPRARELARLAGLRRDRLRFSYLTLRRDRAGIGPGRHRVVSDLLASKGKVELDLCGQGGKVRLRVLGRERTPEAEAARSWRRGDVVTPARIIRDSVASGS